MADYSISFVRSARKELESLSDQLIRRVLPKIESLSRNPRPSGCKKLKGSNDLWRIRVGEYRVVYSIVDREVGVEVIAIRHRSQAYE